MIIELRSGKRGVTEKRKLSVDYLRIISFVRLQNPSRTKISGVYIISLQSTRQQFSEKYERSRGDL